MSAIWRLTNAKGAYVKLLFPDAKGSGQCLPMIL